MRFRLDDAAKKANSPCPASLRGSWRQSEWLFCQEGSTGLPSMVMQDMVLLAHIRSAFALSNATCGSPRMTRELRDMTGSPSVVIGSPG